VAAKTPWSLLLRFGIPFENNLNDPARFWRASGKCLNAGPLETARAHMIVIRCKER